MWGPSDEAVRASRLRGGELGGKASKVQRKTAAQAPLSTLLRASVPEEGKYGYSGRGVVPSRLIVDNGETFRAWSAEYLINHFRTLVVRNG